jgi:hypothetical protein
VQKVKLHRTIILVAAVALGPVYLATDALARGGGGHVSGGLRGGDIGGALGGAHIGRGRWGGMHVGGGAFAADHSRGGMGGGHLGHQQHAHGRRHDRFGFGGYGYENDCLDDYDNGCLDHPTNEDAAMPEPVDPAAVHRSGCRTQTQKVPSEDGGERTVNIVRC